MPDYLTYCILGLQFVLSRAFKIKRKLTSFCLGILFFQISFRVWLKMQNKWMLVKKMLICSLAKKKKKILLFRILPVCKRIAHTKTTSLALIDKGSFYSEGNDAFFLNFKLWHFKVLKSCHIRTWSCSEGSNSKMEPCLSLQSSFRSLCDMIWALLNDTILKYKFGKISLFLLFVVSIAGSYTLGILNHFLNG